MTMCIISKCNKRTHWSEVCYEYDLEDILGLAFFLLVPFKNRVTYHTYLTYCPADNNISKKKQKIILASKNTFLLC